MGFFKKKDSAPPGKVEHNAPPSPTHPGKDPNLIKVFDKFGRELYITKDEWRKSVLPGMLKTNWNNPDQLYNIIGAALKDGFFEDVLGAAVHLHEIDPMSARAACAYGIVLMKNGRLDDAENVLSQHLRKHGEDGSVLTNLAKLYSERKNPEKVDSTLWHALEVDPNQENGLMWFAVRERERKGNDGWLEALRRVASLPNSWRALLWLARHALEAKDIESAQSYYEQALMRVGKNVPTDFLMQMSGDLGRNGYLRESLALTEPEFVPAVHGLSVGNNLIKAHLDLGEPDASKRVLDQLYSLNRPDWKKTLNFWETEIGKFRIAQNQPTQDGPFDVTMLCSEGPVWLSHNSPAAFFGPHKSEHSKVISFLGGTAELQNPSNKVTVQMSDDPGRMSRALPLFLAEQVMFRCSARVQVLVPWMAGPPGGFVLGGVRWSDEHAARYALQAEPKSSYIAVSHLRTTIDPWVVEVRLLESNTGKCLEMFTAAITPQDPEAIVQLSDKLVSLLVKQLEFSAEVPSTIYSIPAGSNFRDYLLRLEQLLAVRCSGMGKSALTGEREIIDGNIQLNVALPKNVPARLLLAQTLLSMSMVRPDVVREFKDKVELVQTDYPLPQNLQKSVNEILSKAFAGAIQ